MKSSTKEKKALKKVPESTRTLNFSARFTSTYNTNLHFFYFSQQSHVFRFFTVSETRKVKSFLHLKMQKWEKKGVRGGSIVIRNMQNALLKNFYRFNCNDIMSHFCLKPCFLHKTFLMFLLFICNAIVKSFKLTT